MLMTCALSAHAVTVYTHDGAAASPIAHNRQRFGPILRAVNLHETHCSISLSRQKHIRAPTIPDGGLPVPEVLHTRFTHSHSASIYVGGVLSGVSKCTKSYHLIAIRININSIFITLHLPLCGKSFCHF